MNARANNEDPPAASGYAMPAEWTAHQATWLSWPHNRDSWPGKFEPVEPVMVRFVAALATHELVRINVLDEAHERHVAGLLEGPVNAANVRFHRFPTNDAWCRDHGAIFVTRQRSVGTEGLAPSPASGLLRAQPERNGGTEGLALDFRFNAWGGKYPPFDLDDAIPEQMAAALGAATHRVDMILEGGSIDVNGAGALLTTESCLLNPNRNPELSRSGIEALLRATLGVSQIIWLGDGIVGDDTDGHIDDLTRFVAEATVITVVESNRTDDNYDALAANRERLDAVRLDDGRRLEVIEMQMPKPVVYKGDRLPASYANFYIGNRTIVLPVFNDPADEPARRVLAGAFPGREVVAIDCTDLVLGLGTFHCLSQQVPVFK